MRPEHWRIARVQALAGLCQLKLGLCTESEINLVKASTYLVIALGHNHPEALAALHQLSDVYETNSRSELTK